MRPLPRTVRERVLADLFKELHAEKAFVARLRDPNVCRGLRQFVQMSKREPGFSQVFDLISLD